MKIWKRIVLFVLIAIQIAGCASVQKKFTRKKKEPAHRPAVMYVEEGPYQKQYSNRHYYRTHYTLWKSWHDDLLDQLGGNHRRSARAAEETYSHLSQMEKYLLPDKQKELESLVMDLKKVTDRISSDGYTRSDEPTLRVELERLKRLIQNDFYEEKVQNHILPDAVDLGTA